MVMIRKNNPQQKIPTSENEEYNPFGLPDIGIPAEVLFNHELSATEKILFGFIRNLAQTKKGCWASNKWLGKLASVGAQTVSNAIAKLAEYGYLNIEYKTLPGGKQVRRIHLNGEIATLYRDLVDAWHNELIPNYRRPPIKKFIDPPIKKFIPPYKKIYNKYDNKNKPKDIYPPDKKIYRAMAKELSGIVQSKKKVNHTPQQLVKWNGHIKKLIEDTLPGSIDENIARVQSALDWYAKHIGEPYVPVIESGASLFEKFTKLEDAIARSQTSPKAMAKGPSIKDKYAKVKIKKIGDDADAK